MPNQVTTGFGTCKAGPVRNNHGTILMAGNADTSVTNSVSLPSNLNSVPTYASKLTAAVSPASSGNVGTTKVNTNANFGNADPHFIMTKLTTTIDGNSNTILQAAAGDTGQRRPIPREYAGFTRSDNINFNILPGGSGKITHGANFGTDVLVSGIDGTTGFFADKAVGRNVGGVPFKFTFMYGNPNASGKAYTSATNP